MSDLDWEPARAAAPPDRTATAPLLRGLFAMILVFGVAAVFLLTRGGDETGLTSPGTEAPAATISPAVPPLAAPTGGATGTAAPLPGPTGSAAASAPAGQSGSGVTVQVLDGVGDTRFEEAVAAIEALGYDVGLTEEALPRAETTVFFSEGFEQAATDLVAADGRFTMVDPDNPGLDPSFDLHIVVGADWPEADGDAAGDAAPATTVPTPTG